MCCLNTACCFIQKGGSFTAVIKFGVITVDQHSDWGKTKTLSSMVQLTIILTPGMAPLPGMCVKTVDFLLMQ